MLNFERVFRHGQVFRLDGQEAIASVAALGRVDLPTGLVQVGDPLMCNPRTLRRNDSKRQVEVAPGSYLIERSDSDVPLAVRIVFSTKPASRWEPSHHAVITGAAYIAIADHSALPLLASLSDDALEARVGSVAELGGEIQLLKRRFGPVKLGKVRLVVFPTDFGEGVDGMYPCYWGIGDRDETVSLVIDMGGLYVWRYHDVRVTRSALALVGKIEEPALAEVGVSIDVLCFEEHELSVKVEGDCGFTDTWSLRCADGTPVRVASVRWRASRRQRERVLRFKTLDVIPEDVHLLIRIPMNRLPMMPVESEE